MESSPSLICENESDLYTVSSSSQGNKALMYPIGLITADEVILSGTGGGVFDGNYSYQKTNPNGYLTIGNSYWTMTPVGGYNPFVLTGWGSSVFGVGTSGYLDDFGSTSSLGLRSVINLRSDVTITGEGTKDNPYQLV